MDRSEIASLIDALCDAPLDGQTEVSAELRALRRKAIAARLAATGTGDEASAADADRLTATLAAALSHSDEEFARRALADPALRLDAESALAFLDAVEQSSQTAPSHLVDELVAAEAGAKPKGGATAPGLRQRIADGFWPARRWQVVAACAVMLFASAAVLSIGLRGTDQAANPPASVATTNNAGSAPAVAAGVPAAPPPSVLAEKPRCEPAQQSAATTDQPTTANTKTMTVVAAANDCDAAPGNGVADASVREALEKYEEARRAAAARIATDAAAKASATQADRAPAEAHRLDRVFGVSSDRPAAAARSAPAAAAPAAKPAAVAPAAR